MVAQDHAGGNAAAAGTAADGDQRLSEGQDRSSLGGRRRAESPNCFRHSSRGGSHQGYPAILNGSSTGGSGGAALMVSLLQSMMGSAGFKMNDRVIANDALMGLKGGAVAYLGAILESATPEVRRMYSEYLTQLIMAHEAMTALAVKKGWYQPY